MPRLMSVRFTAGWNHRNFKTAPFAFTTAERRTPTEGNPR